MRKLPVFAFAAVVALSSPGVASAEPLPAAPTTKTAYADPAAAVPADYWTPERMRIAEENTARAEADVKVKSTAPAPLKATVQTTRSLAEPAAPVIKQDVTANVYMTHTVGKVYYDNAAGESRVCSASVVNSNGKNMLFTAGHCVHAGDGGQWHRLNTWEFHAGRTDNGTRDGHTFRLHSTTTWVPWIEDGESAYDDAVVILQRNQYGQRAADLVGANGLETGGPKDQFHTILGYFESHNHQSYMEGLTGASAIYPNMMSFQGRIGPGASGGPWLLRYTNSSNGYGVGYVHGVTSIGNVFNWSWSPYFVDAVEGQLYRDHKDIHT